MQFSLLVVSLFPSGVATFFYLLRIHLIASMRKTSLLQTMARMSGQHYLMMYLVALGLIFGLDVVVFDMSFRLIPSSLSTFGMLIVGGTILAFVLELLVAQAWRVVTRFRAAISGKTIITAGASQQKQGMVTAAAATSRIASQHQWMVFALTFLLVPVLEEFVFRGALFWIIEPNLYWVHEPNPLFYTIIISSVAFALSHVTFGFRTLLQKFITGIVLGVSFVLGDYNILIPILIHLFENGLIMLYLSYQLRRSI